MSLFAYFPGLRPGSPLLVPHLGQCFIPETQLRVKLTWHCTDRDAAHTASCTYATSQQLALKLITIEQHIAASFNPSICAELRIRKLPRLPLLLRNSMPTSTVPKSLSLNWSELHVLVASVVTARDHAPTSGIPHALYHSAAQWIVWKLSYIFGWLTLPLVGRYCFDAGVQVF